MYLTRIPTYLLTWLLGACLLSAWAAPPSSGRSLSLATDLKNYDADWNLIVRMMELLGFRSDEIPYTAEDFCRLKILAKLETSASGELYNSPYSYNLQAMGYQRVFEIVPIPAGFAIRRSGQTTYLLVSPKGVQIGSMSLPAGLELGFEEPHGVFWARDGLDWYRFRQGETPRWLPLRGNYFFSDPELGIWFGDYVRRYAKAPGYRQPESFILQRYRQGRVEWAELPENGDEIPYVLPDGDGKLYLVFAHSSVVVMDLARSEYRYINFYDIFKDSLYGGKSANYERVEFRGDKVDVEVSMFDYGTCYCPGSNLREVLPLSRFPKQKLRFSASPPRHYRP